MTMHSELKSKRWEWLTEGWEVVEDVREDRIRQYWLEEMGFGKRRYPIFEVEPSYFYAPYVPLPQVPVVTDGPPVKGILTKYGAKMLKEAAEFYAAHPVEIDADRI